MYKRKNIFENNTVIVSEIIYKFKPYCAVSVDVLKNNRILI